MGGGLPMVVSTHETVFQVVEKEIATVVTPGSLSPRKAVVVESCIFNGQYV